MDKGKKTDNTMDKRRRTRQYNGQKKKDQTIQWTKEEGPVNIMDKRRRTSQYNGQKKKDQTIQWTKQGQTIQWTKEEGQSIH
jgi:predicted lipoprotein with Yx(FWY)xxD motif